MFKNHLTKQHITPPPSPSRIAQSKRRAHHREGKTMHQTDRESLIRYRDAIDAAHEVHRAMNAIKDLTIPTEVRTRGGVEPRMDQIIREDFCALLGIVNGHLGRALEMASGKGAV